MTDDAAGAFTRTRCGRRVVMVTWLAVHDLPANSTDEDVHTLVQRVRRTARELGATPLETFYSRGMGQVMGLFDAEDATIVETAHERAGTEHPVVCRADRIPGEATVDAQ